jgi:hypothetical protein
MRSSLHPRRFLCLCLSLGLGSVGCKDQGPAVKGPPYLAILPLASVAEGAVLPPSVSYRVHMLSEPSTVDVTIQKLPHDTVIMSLPPATYSVELSGLPQYCYIRDGSERLALVLPKTNTTLVRFSYGCRLSLKVNTVTQGAPPGGPPYALRITRGTEIIRDAVMKPLDSLLLNGLPAGQYRLELRSVPTECIVANDAGRIPVVDVPAIGGAEIVLRVDCATPGDRPNVIAFGASHRSGTLGFYAAVTDPNRDIDRYVINLTDCQGGTLFPKGARTFSGLARSPIGPDTVYIVSAVETQLPDSATRNACAALRIVDLAGNSSGVYEVPLATDSANAPRAQSFNALFSGSSAIVTTLAVDDPDNDYAGAFLAFTLRDGALGNTVDGQPEYGIYSINGVRGQSLPVIPLGNGHPDYADYQSVIVYLIDKRGHVTRLEDTNLFR